MSTESERAALPPPAPPPGRVLVDRTDLFLVLGALAAAIEGKWHPRLDRAWTDLHADARRPS